MVELVGADTLEGDRNRKPHIDGLCQCGLERPACRRRCDVRQRVCRPQTPQQWLRSLQLTPRVTEFNVECTRAADVQKWALSAATARNVDLSPPKNVDEDQDEKYTKFSWPLEFTVVPLDASVSRHGPLRDVYFDYDGDRASVRTCYCACVAARRGSLCGSVCPFCALRWPLRLSWFSDDVAVVAPGEIEEAKKFEPFEPFEMQSTTVFPFHVDHGPRSTVVTSPRASKDAVTQNPFCCGLDDIHGRAPLKEM